MIEGRPGTECGKQVVATVDAACWVADLGVAGRCVADRSAARDENLITSIDMSQPPGVNVITTFAGLAPGVHTLAVAVHQSGTGSSDFGLALKMSGIEAPGQCVLAAAASNVVRSDAGTPGNSGDDTYSFNVTVDGTNAGATWNSNSLPASGSYGVVTAFGPFLASAGSTTVVFSSAIDPACTASVTVVPPGCTMSAAVSNVARDGAGTPVDSSDDTFSFDVTLTGTFLSTQWTSDQAVRHCHPLWPVPCHRHRCGGLHRFSRSCLYDVGVRFAPPVCPPGGTGAVCKDLESHEPAGRCLARRARRPRS